MALLDSLAVVVHFVFAGLWAGTVAYAAAIVTGTGDIGTVARERIADRLRSISRTSAVLTLLSGGYLASGFASSYFYSSTRGYLLSAMVLLWLVLMVMVEIGASRLVDGEESGPTVLIGASVVAILLLLDAGVVSTMG